MTSSAIPPAPPPVPVQTSGGGGAAVTMAVASGAEALAKMPAGALVIATLEAVESNALIKVATSSGTTLELRLPPNLTLPPDSELSLQLLPQPGGGLAMKLLAVNGRPLGLAPQLGAGALPGLAELLGPAKPGAPNGPGMAEAQPQPGLKPASAGPMGIAATVLRPNPAGAFGAPGSAQAGQPFGQPEQAPPGLADLAPGTQLTIRIAKVQPPGQGAPLPPLAAQAQAAATPQAGPERPQTMSGQPQAPAPNAPAAPVQPSQPQTGHQPQNPGQDSQGQAGQRAPQAAQAAAPATQTPAPASSQASPASPSQPIPLSGTVVAQSHGGAALVQTPAGLLSLPAAAPLPTGSALQLEVIAPPNPPSAPAEAAKPQGLTQEGWPALQGAVDALAQSDRAAAEQLIRSIPQANPRLAAAMSLFAGAVKAGDIRGIGGDKVLGGLDRAGRKDLAERLKKDFAALTEDAARPRGEGEWSLITLPFAHGAQVDPIRLYVQRVSGDDPSKGGAKGQEQRFILEVSMSRLGRIQFDGLVMKDQKRFDLIIRSNDALAPDIRQDIAGIFAQCGQMTGVKGTIGFQSGRAFVELPPTDAKGTRIVV